MNSNYKICEGCRIKRSCHPNLIPQRLTSAALFEDIEKDQELKDWKCRHDTCSPNGVRAATEVLNNDGEPWVQVMVHKLDGSVARVSIKFFGTPHKPTKTLDLRGVSKKGNIYSRQDGEYYRAGSITASE